MQSSAVSAEQLAAEFLDVLGVMKRGGQDDFFRVAAELDLSFSQLRALAALDSRPDEPALGELAAQIRLSLAATGRAVDALVRAGLVARREDAIDRRVKRLALSPEGRAALQRVSRARREGAQRLFARLDDGERAALSRALAPLLAEDDR